MTAQEKHHAERNDKNGEDDREDDQSPPLIARLNREIRDLYILLRSERRKFWDQNEKGGAARSRPARSADGPFPGR